MILYDHLVFILKNLQTVLERKIEGDIVELGCNIGTVSVNICKLLDIYKSNKQFHVYDSWQGIPELNDYEKQHAEEFFWINRQFRKGDASIKKENFIDTIKSRGLKLPIIHSGWFADIPENEYPEKICFAFFDGDVYSSIIDSFNRTFHKIQKDGIIIVHDYGWEPLPGVEKACQDFLKDKKETVEVVVPARWMGSSQTQVSCGFIKKM